MRKGVRKEGWGVGVKTPPFSLDFTKTLLLGECIGLIFYKNKGTACRRVCLLCQQTSPKRWFENMNMTSNCDVINSAHQMQMTTICL